MAGFSRRIFLKATTLGAASLALPGLFCTREPQIDLVYERVERFYYKSALHRPGVSTCSDPTGHYATFQRLPMAEIAKELGLEAKASILYPGAGAHLAAFEIGNSLTHLLRPVSDVRYIFTEYEAEGMDGVTEKRFELLMAAAEPDLRIIGKREIQLTKGYEVSYDLLIFGVPVVLAYAINVPTIRDQHTFFTDQQVYGADVVVFHDALTANDDQLALGVVLVAKMAAESGTRKALIFEDIARVMDKKASPSVYDVLPGRTILVEGEYGCSHEGCGSLYGYRGAVVYFPDIDLIRTSKGVQYLETLPSLNYCRGAKRILNERIRKPNGGLEAID